MPRFTPTAEQQAAIDLFRSGRSLAIEAGAGTGKTSTLELLAEAMAPGARGQYVAFNRAIAREAGSKMPGHVAASTAHSLAFRAVGYRYKRRLDQGRMRPQQVARILGIDPFTVQYADERKVLQPGFLAGVTMRAILRFCQSADLEPGEQHFDYIDGIDLPTPDGRRGWAANRQVRSWLALPLARAWADLQRVDGSLKFEHDHYLKLWHLSEPRIPVDVIFFDEAQDANPVLSAVIAAQAERGVQLVWVGDSQQQIYEFTGAVNALAEVPADDRTFLTQSFRFGPAIAGVANQILELIDGAELRLVGTPTIASVVAPTVEPDAVLFRTNAAAVGRALREIAAGRRPHIVGGADDIVRFSRAVIELRDTGYTGHPDLACFTSWSEVVDYVAAGDDADLALLVRLIEEFTPERILAELDNMAPEGQADIVLSTAHKSKGREWPVVQLGGDFRPRDKGGLEPSELRLLYVACTRARLELDHTAVRAIIEGDDPDLPRALVRDLAAVGRIAEDRVAADVFPEIAGGPAVVAEAEQVALHAAGMPTFAEVEAWLLQEPSPATDDELMRNLEADADERTPFRVCPRCGDPSTARASGMVGAHRCTGLR